MDLYSTKNDYFRWTGTGWGMVLELAEKNGWVPIGTGPPRGTPRSEWPGHYFGNDGQLVCARDAKRLADALEEAIRERRKSASRAKKGSNDGLLETTDQVRAMKEFVQFCRKGSFRIH